MHYDDFSRQLRQKRVSAINILSNEGDIYTVEAVIDGEGYTIQGRESPDPLCFYSYREAKLALEQLGDIPLRLQTSLAYDEMVGEPGP